MNHQNQGFLKYILLLTAVASITLQSSAQKLEIDQVSLAYFAPLAVDPGLKAGVGFSFHKWNKTRENKKGISKTYNHKLYIQPQLAYISKWRFYTSYLANVEAGWKFQQEGKRFYSGFGMGLGYIYRQEVLNLRVFFDGSTKVVETEARNYFFPSVNYQMGMKFYRKIDLFSKIHYGYQFSSKYTSESNLILEIGFHLNLMNKNKDG